MVHSPGPRPTILGGPRLASDRPLKARKIGVVEVVHGVLVLDHASPFVLRLVDPQLLQTAAEHLSTRACRGALPAPPCLFLRTVADPCIEAGVPDDRRGAGMDCFCRQPTERAGAHRWPELARCMSGASAPILERCARLEGLFPVRASERVGRGAVRAHERERGAASDAEN